MAKPKRLTRRQRWTSYIRQLADALHLRDWRIEVSEELPAGENSIASCQPVYGRKYAVIRLSEGFLNDDHDEQRHTVIHELLHCHTGPMNRLLEAEESFTASVRQTMEYMVDGLADAIAPLLPLPPASTRSQH